MRRIGVILAAGRGRRMGGTKQLVLCETPAGRKPLVAAAFDAIRPICERMIVVVGHETDAVVAALGEREFDRVVADADAPMFESVRTGLKAARQIEPMAGVVLQPSDHPNVASSTLAALIEWANQRPAHAIIPQFAERGGHPAILPPNIVALLIDADCPTGLGDFWLAHSELCCRVPVDDASVLRDIDTPDDLVAGKRDGDS